MQRCMPFIVTHFSFNHPSANSLMELNDDDFSNSDGVTHFSGRHPYLYHHWHVDHPSMSCIPTSVACISSSSFNHPFTTPSSELCHMKPDKSCGLKRKRGSVGGAVEGTNLNSSDVIHVRVQRGQATDSHSLAERVRRKKINEKLQSLHNIVPGCHKTMGMAVMLDVVIKYIQSLQNQTEFLSMRLLAASLLHDQHTPDMDTMGTVQTQVHRAEIQEMEGLAAQGYGRGSPYFNSTLFSHESLQNQ